jgi:hypothetical protein
MSLFSNLNCDTNIIQGRRSRGAASEDRSKELAAGSGPSADEVFVFIVNLNGRFIAQSFAGTVV